MNIELRGKNKHLQDFDKLNIEVKEHRVWSRGEPRVFCKIQLKQFALILL